MRTGRAVPPDRHRRDPRRAHGCAARPVDRVGPRQDRPHRGRPRQGALRVPPRLPGQPAQARLQLRAVGAQSDEGHEADGVRARRDREGTPRAAVLVLLPLQRLQQHPRGRLGDDPAQLRRAGCATGARDPPDRGRLLPARRGRALGVGRREAEQGRRDAPGRLRGRGLARELLRLRALPRALGVGGSRLRRHPRPEHADPARRRHDPERSGRRVQGVSVDRVRGSLGRAAACVLQRPHRPEHEGAVDQADHLVRGTGATGATGSRRAASSARRRPARSAAPSRPGRTSSGGSRTTRRSRSAFWPGSRS